MTGTLAQTACRKAKFPFDQEVRSGGFEFEGTYTRVVPNKVIDFKMSDGREVNVEFVEGAGSVLVKETFDAETENSAEMQRAGWQSILDNFGRYVEKP